MSIDQKVQLSLIVLLTGVVIVFAMLVFLTIVIKGYSSAVRSIMSNRKNKKAKIDMDSSQTKEKDVKIEASVPESSKTPPEPIVSLNVESGISEEVVAAVSAAVYTTYSTSCGEIKSIRRSVQPNRSAWGMAGLLESTRPF